MELMNEKISSLGFLKRVIDILFGLVGCIIMAILAIVIKIAYLKNGDKTPILFKQKRIGYQGEIIEIYKFRSMVQDADNILEELMRTDKKIYEEYTTNKKLQNDPRVTSVGRIIRRTSIDELPQFLNILKGEMSLVGPRPYLLREREDMGNYYYDIILCKPGLTGKWQISGRSDLSFKKRLALDSEYVRTYSLYSDLRIILYTVRFVITGKGAV